MVSKFFLSLLFTWCALASGAPCQTLPRMEGETLSGKPALLPDAAHGKVALLAIGFSKKGGDSAKAWSERFRQDFGKDSNYAIYPVAELEDAPRLIRGLIKSGMRKDVPLEAQDRFVLLFKDSAEWKKFVNCVDSDEGYLLLLGADGEIKWRGHGLFREDNYAPLREAAKSLAGKQ